jgi:hypothetical protein
VLGGAEENHDPSTEDTRTESPTRGLNPGPPDYRAGVPTTGSRSSVMPHSKHSNLLSRGTQNFHFETEYEICEPC